MEKGLVHIYTGNGKGKTSAAVGLAVRAGGHGNHVLLYQFLKPKKLELGERTAFSFTMGRIDVKVLDAEWDMTKGVEDPEQTQAVKNAIDDALDDIEDWVGAGAYEVFILDEIVYCAAKSLVSVERIKQLIDAKAEHVEIILTGRGASEEMIALADYVTEMKEVKHPFREGIEAREGIEY